MKSDPKSVSLTSDDLKMLNFRKNVNLAVGGLVLIFVTVGFVGAIYLGFIDGSGMPALIIAGLSFIVGLMPFFLLRNYRRMKSDIVRGVKNEFDGQITNKFRNRGKCILVVDGNSSRVDYHIYSQFHKGDLVKYGMGPASKILLSISSA